MTKCYGVSRDHNRLKLQTSLGAGYCQAWDLFGGIFSSGRGAVSSNTYCGRSASLQESDPRSARGARGRRGAGADTSGFPLSVLEIPGASEMAASLAILAAADKAGKRRKISQRLKPGQKRPMAPSEGTGGHVCSLCQGADHGPVTQRSARARGPRVFFFFLRQRCSSQ